MIKYNCGHEVDLIIPSNPLSMILYTEWLRQNKTQCWKCWIKNKR